MNHPGWDWATIKNDIGLLMTMEEIHFTKRVRPIAVNCDWIDGGQVGYVTGWGQMEVSVLITGLEVFDYFAIV